MIVAMKIATIIVRITSRTGVRSSSVELRFFHFIPNSTAATGLGRRLRQSVYRERLRSTSSAQCSCLSGLLLLIGRFVPLALTILAAIIFNILVVSSS